MCFFSPISLYPIPILFIILPHMFASAIKAVQFLGAISLVVAGLQNIVGESVFIEWKDKKMNDCLPDVLHKDDFYIEK